MNPSQREHNTESCSWKRMLKDLLCGEYLFIYYFLPEKRHFLRWNNLNDYKVLLMEVVFREKLWYILLELKSLWSEILFSISLSLSLFEKTKKFSQRKSQIICGRRVLLPKKEVSSTNSSEKMFYQESRKPYNGRTECFLSKPPNIFFRKS